MLEDDRALFIDPNTVAPVTRTVEDAPEDANVPTVRVTGVRVVVAVPWDVSVVAPVPAGLISEVDEEDERKFATDTTPGFMPVSICEEDEKSTTCSAVGVICVELDVEEELCAGISWAPDRLLVDTTAVVRRATTVSDIPDNCRSCPAILSPETEPGSVKKTLAPLWVPGRKLVTDLTIVVSISPTAPGFRQC